MNAIKLAPDVSPDEDEKEKIEDEVVIEVSETNQNI